MFGIVSDFNTGCRATRGARSRCEPSRVSGRLERDAGKGRLGVAKPSELVEAVGRIETATADEPY